ncbi:MAG: hypothetical protein H6718_30345 [Polyangiaceae bacterium]|nr:hypothetical protein [Polyangiaceae bacterium]
MLRVLAYLWGALLLLGMGWGLADLSLSEEAALTYQRSICEGSECTYSQATAGRYPRPWNVTCRFAHPKSGRKFPGHASTFADRDQAASYGGTTRYCWIDAAGNDVRLEPGSKGLVALGALGVVYVLACFGGFLMLAGRDFRAHRPARPLADPPEWLPESLRTPPRRIHWEEAPGAMPQGNAETALGFRLVPDSGGNLVSLFVVMLAVLGVFLTTIFVLIGDKAHPIFWVLGVPIIAVVQLAFGGFIFSFFFEPLRLELDADRVFLGSRPIPSNVDEDIREVTVHPDRWANRRWNVSVNGTSLLDCQPGPTRTQAMWLGELIVAWANRRRTDLLELRLSETPPPRPLSRLERQARAERRAQREHERRQQRRLQKRRRRLEEVGEPD